MIWFVGYWIFGIVISFFDFFVISKNIYDDEPSSRQKLIMFFRSFLINLFWPAFIIFYIVMIVVIDKYFKNSKGE